MKVSAAAGGETRAEAPIKLAVAAPRTRYFKRIVFLPCESAGALRAGFFHYVPSVARGISWPGLVPGRGTGPECALSIWERPHPEFLLSDLPQPGKTGRLGDQEQNNERSQHHKVDVLERGRGHGNAGRLLKHTQNNRQAPDQGRPEERAEQAAEPADDHHE